MKGFFTWFKSSTKIKRWIFLILLGIILACYGFAQVLVTNELSFKDIAKIVAVFVIRIYFCYFGNSIYSKKNIRAFYRRKPKKGKE